MLRCSWNDLPIARKFAFVSAILTLSVSLIIGIAASFLVYRQIIAEINQELQREAETGSQRIALYFEAARSNLESLSESGLVVNGVVDSFGRQEYLEPFLRDFAISEYFSVDVGVFNLNGEVLARSSPIVGAKDVNDTGFKLAVQGIGHAERHRDPGGSADYIAITLPIIYEATGRAEGVLLGRIHVETLPSLMGTSFDDGLYSHLVNAYGYELGNWQWPEGVKLLSREAKVVLPAPLDNLQLSFRVARKMSDIYAVVFDFLTGIGLVAIAGTAAITLISVWFGRRLGKPLRELQNAATRIVEEAQFEIELPELGKDEVGQLAASFRDMLGHVKVSYSVLEARVTQRTRELDEAKMQLQSILDNVVDGIVSIDLNGRFVSANQAALALFGCEESELVGRNITDFLDIEDIGTFINPASEDYRLGQGRILNETTLYPVGKSDLPIEYAIGEPVDVEGKSLTTLLIRDITERKEIERLKEEFISTVSHELRTPLTSIVGAIALAKRDEVITQSARLQKLLDVAAQNTDRLGRLVDDILDLEKLESGKLSFEHTDLDLEPIIRQAVTACTPYAQRHGKPLRLIAPFEKFTVLADEGRLGQVLNNLISNSVKYSGPSSEVTITMARYHDKVRIALVDQGDGIAPDLRKFMFTRFWQADGSNTRRTSGTGLGLAITRALVEGNNGTISYRSRKGVGSVFFFDLPLTGDATPREKEQGEEPTIAVNARYIDENTASLGIDTKGLLKIETPAEAILYLETGAFERVHSDQIANCGPEYAANDEQVRSVVEQSNSRNKHPLIW
ncbi:ATP-binding protein [Thalassospira sp.]|uniref:sensor histidine kinase n=1 Tax=Thalassospira sp. TaxID=1912094 RepID=UPI003AA948C7